MLSWNLTTVIKSFRNYQSLNCHKIWQFRCLPFVLSIYDSFNIEGQDETALFSDDKLFCEHAMNLRKADFKEKTALKLLEYYFEWYSSWCLESRSPFCIRNRAVAAQDLFYALCTQPKVKKDTYKIEKYILWIIWTCDCFWDFITGLVTCFEINHKALVPTRFQNISTLVPCTCKELEIRMMTWFFGLHICRKTHCGIQITLTGNKKLTVGRATLYILLTTGQRPMLSTLLP